MIKEVRMTALVLSSNWGFCCGEVPGRCLLALPGRCLLAVTARDHPDTPHQVLRLSPLVEKYKSLRNRGQPWPTAICTTWQCCWTTTTFHRGVMNTAFHSWRE
ncbi:unnamed protein product [Ectocarpus sp. 12 AP-2014]